MSDQERYRLEPAGNTGATHAQPFYGLTVVSGTRGVIRQSERGLLIFDAAGCTEIDLPVAARCTAELVELRDSLAQQRPVFPDGRWGRDTLEIASWMWRSSIEGREISALPALPADTRTKAA